MRRPVNGAFKYVKCVYGIMPSAEKRVTKVAVNSHQEYHPQDVLVVHIIQPTPSTDSTKSRPPQVS